MTTMAATVPATVWEVTGPDRLTYLDAVLTQQVAGAEPGSATSALLLDAHGSPLLVVDLAVLDDRVVLVAPAELAEDIDRLLAKRTFLAQASFAVLDDVVVRVVGDGDLPGGTSRGRAAVTPRGVEMHVAAGLLIVTSTPDDTMAELEQLGVRRVDELEMTRRDVVDGRPRWGEEIVQGHLPEELGLLPTHVHLAKGCYPGQEAVARMWMLGRPRRRLAVVLPDASVEDGWDSGGGRKGARVTRSVVTSDGRRALAFVPGDASPGTRVEDEDGLGVEVLLIVGDEEPVVGHDPAVTRRRDRR